MFILIKENEEIYGILSGNGKAIIDGEEISLSTGDWLKIAPAAKRQFFASDISGITYICIQVKENSLEHFTAEDCRNRLIKSIYLQKCTVHDKLRTVHFSFCSILRFLNFSNKNLFNLLNSFSLQTWKLTLLQFLRANIPTHIK